MNELILQPMVQYGFVGFAAALLAIVVWLIKQLLSVLRQTSSVIAANTAAVRDLTALAGDLLKLNRSLHDKIISRPCIAKGERQS